MNSSFKTKVKLDVSLDGLDNHSILTHDFNLRWNVEFEVRQFGIKSVIVTVPDQVVEVDYALWTEDEDEFHSKRIEIKDVEIDRKEVLETLIPTALEYFQGKWKLVF